MKDVYRLGRRRDAQTLVFFILAFGTIILLCGLAIDSGLMFLAKARLARAVDGASLAAIGNFHRSDDPATNRNDVALIIRNFAVANYTDLGAGPYGGIGSDPSTAAQPVQTYTQPNGTTGYNYTYNFNDGSQDANGAYKRFVQVVLTTGSNGSITAATTSARCPVQTYFIGFAGSFFRDLKVSSTATATRNPRLIMIVLDRSASMLQSGGGAFGLPQAVTQFLDFFDTSSDSIGIVSFGTNARLEMPMTTNFIVAGTNVLFDSYEIDNTEGGSAVPGADPEQFSTNGDYDPNYATTGVRRMKFGGQTAADDGIRLAMETMMTNSGFTDPDVVKYLVLFTDGRWNITRTLFAAPGYTNVVTYPTASEVSAGKMVGNTNVWNATSLAANAGVFPVPSLSPMPFVTNAIVAYATNGDYSDLLVNHTNDVWQSADGTAQETLATPSTTIVGAPATYTTNTFLGKYSNKNTYATNLDVWLQPGSVDYTYHGGSVSNTYVSDYTQPTQHINVALYSGDSNVLVVPGYVIDGLAYDGLDLNYPDNPDYPRYRVDNYNEPFMWPDDATAATASPFQSTSLERQLMFRNYANLLTGFYINRADDPYGTGIEHYITDGPLNPGAYRPLNGLGPYYPSSAFYWPFDLVGEDYDPTYSLTNATVDPDTTHQGLARKAAWSINMLSQAAAPEWAGEWFYKGSAGTNTVSGTGTTSISTLMGSKADWENSAPSWVLDDFDHIGENITTTEAAHNGNLAVNVWRPVTFNGSNNLVIGGLSGCVPTDVSNYTGGYVTDHFGNYYRNTMAWSGRPTHYFDFSQGKWIPIGSNHITNSQFLQLGNWKAREYAWHARAMGVTIYTVGYGYLVTTAQQALLAQMANATNTTAGNAQGYDTNGNFYYTPGPGTAIVYNASQPIGQQFFATNITDISNDFYQVGQAINAALTQ